MPTTDHPLVLVLDDDAAVVGQAALDVSLEQPDRVAAMSKRLAEIKASRTRR